MQKKTLAIFDFDGTIANLQIDWKKLKKTIGSIVGLKKEHTSFATQIASIRKNNLKLYIQKIKPIIKKYEKEGIQNVTFNPKIVKLINKYPKTAILSNNYKETILTALSKVSLNIMPDIIIGFDDVSNPKPSPDGILEIIRLMKVNKNNVILYGNSWMDKKAGRLAKVKTILIEKNNDN